MGILGVLNENLLDISAQFKEQIALLQKTPSAGILGSCRYKIKSEEDLERIVEVFKYHNIGYFFYCGGGTPRHGNGEAMVHGEEKQQQ